MRNVILLYTIGIALLCISLPLVWYSDAHGDLRGIDGRYFEGFAGLASPFLRMPVITMGVAAVIGAASHLMQNRVLGAISIAVSCIGAFIFAYGTVAVLSQDEIPAVIIKTLELSSVKPRMETGAYVFMAGFITIITVSAACLFRQNQKTDSRASTSA